MAKSKKVNKEEDKTIIYMVVGFCIGVIVTLFMFEYYWIGVGGGVGMLVGVIASIISDSIVAKDEKVVKPKKVAKTSKKKK